MRLTPPRPSHPASNVRDDREAPLMWKRDGDKCKFDLGSSRSDLFLPRRLDSFLEKRSDLPVGQSHTTHHIVRRTSQVVTHDVATSSLRATGSRVGAPDDRLREAIQGYADNLSLVLDCFASLAMTAALFGRYKKLCGSTSTSSLRLPVVFGPTASHCRKYSDRSKPRTDFSSSRNR
jgi:hypothetical protein